MLDMALRYSLYHDALGPVTRSSNIPYNIVYRFERVWKWQTDPIFALGESLHMIPVVRLDYTGVHLQWCKILYGQNVYAEDFS